VSIIYKFMLGFLFLTIATMDHAIAYYIQFLGILTIERFITYRFFYEIIIGTIGFYFLLDTIIKDINYNQRVNS
ncbi:MAG: hypothetical protein ACTSQI_22605, partial [Candidatus Helarchaeota archaeon]